MSDGVARVGCRTIQARTAAAPNRKTIPVVTREPRVGVRLMVTNGATTAGRKKTVAGQGPRTTPTEATAIDSRTRNATGGGARERGTSIVVRWKYELATKSNVTASVRAT